MIYTAQEISRINGSRQANPGVRYIQDNGAVWEGTVTKSLILIQGPVLLPPNASTESTALRQANTLDNITVEIENLNDVDFSTSTKQDELLEELKLKGTIENQEVNNLDNYHIISLLTNILKELKEQTRYIKKIYQ